MPRLSDRYRRQFALPAAILYHLFSGCLEFRKSQGWTPGEADIEALTRLGLAANEPFDGLEPKHHARLGKAVNRDVLDLLAPYRGADMRKAYLVVLIWLRNLIEEDRITLIADSNFDKAAQIILPWVADSGLPAAMVESAEKQARKFDARVQERGYFRLPAGEVAA